MAEVPLTTERRAGRVVQEVSGTIVDTDEPPPAEFVPPNPFVLPGSLNAQDTINIVDPVSGNTVTIQAIGTGVHILDDANTLIQIVSGGQVIFPFGLALRTDMLTNPPTGFTPREALSWEYHTEGNFLEYDGRTLTNNSATFWNSSVFIRYDVPAATRDYKLSWSIVAGSTALDYIVVQDMDDAFLDADDIELPEGLILGTQIMQGPVAALGSSSGFIRVSVTQGVPINFRLFFRGTGGGGPGATIEHGTLELTPVL